MYGSSKLRSSRDWNDCAFSSILFAKTATAFAASAVVLKHCACTVTEIDDPEEETDDVAD